MIRTLITERAIQGENRDIEFIISNERKDGHGTIIPLKNWDIEDFNKSGAFYYQHLTNGGLITDSNPDYALGPAIAKLQKDHLAGVGTFETEDINPLAEKIYKKVNFGTMRTTSVGFVPVGDDGHWGLERNGEDPTAYYFGAVRLVEWSIVHIPSNPDAIKKSLESMSKYMFEKIDSHKSEGFKRDYRFNLLNAKMKLL